MATRYTASGPDTTGRNAAATTQVGPAIPPATVRLMSGSVSGSVSASWPSRWPRPVAMSPDTVADTLGWLDREIETGQGAATVAVPLLGSDTWAALPDDEAAKWAAVFRAARTWLADYAQTGQHAWHETREELARFEGYASERDRVHYAPLRQAAQEAAAGIERRERAAARTDLPNRTGPELIAAAYASWGLAPPAPEVRIQGAPAAGQSVSVSCHDPRALEVV